MADDNTTTLDQDAVKMASFKVWTYKMGEQVSAMIHLGDRLGLYRAMAGAGAMTPNIVAEKAGLHPRFVHEWLYGQAAAGLMDYDDGAFTLTNEQAAVLADESDSLAFAAGAFRGGMEPHVLDHVAQAFEIGRAHV